jgi:hypothetical protein
MLHFNAYKVKPAPWLLTLGLVLFHVLIQSLQKKNEALEIFQTFKLENI